MKAYNFQVNNIEVARSFVVGLPNTMLDEHQLVQVILKILTNAQQAIRSQRDKGRLSIKTFKTRNRIGFSISDDGPGITKEHMDKIFDPFFITKQVGQGTGLGLSISYGIINQHGGEIWAESTPGEGSTFVVELPAELSVELPAELLVDESAAEPSSPGPANRTLRWAPAGVGSGRRA